MRFEYIDRMKFGRYNVRWFKTAYESRVREVILVKSDVHLKDTSFEDELKEIHFEAMNHPVMNQFISNVYGGDYDEVMRISRCVKEDIKMYFKEFLGQFPTGKQVYYYMELCRELGEEPKRIETNFHILKETSRLRGEIKRRNLKIKQDKHEESLKEKIREVESLIATRKSLKISQNDIINSSTLTSYLVRAIENPEKIKRVRSVADIDRYIAYTKQLIKEKSSEGVAKYDLS